MKSFSTMAPPFRTYKHQEYNPVDNSINIAVGDRYNLGNGYRLTIKEDCVWGEGYGSGSSADDERMNALVHFADQQYFSSMIDDNSTPMVLHFLKELGVDTSKEFMQLQYDSNNLSGYLLYKELYDYINDRTER